MSGVVNFLVVIAMIYVLIKIPFWILGSLRLSSGRSAVAGLARAYVTGRALGAIGLGGRGMRPGRSGSAVGGSPANLRARKNPSTSRQPSDPPWPPPIREWAGVDGIFSPEGLERHMRAQHAAERARAGISSGVPAPPFQQAEPASPTAEHAMGRVTSAPAPVQFEAVDSSRTTSAGRPEHPPRPRHRSRRPGQQPPFHVAGAQGRPTTRRLAPARGPVIKVAAVPVDLAFKPAQPAPPSPLVRRTSTPPSAIPFEEPRLGTPPAPWWGRTPGLASAPFSSPAPATGPRTRQAQKPPQRPTKRGDSS